MTHATFRFPTSELQQFVEDAGRAFTPCAIGSPFAVRQSDGLWSTITLKITTDEGPKEITLKLEGRIAGLWVPEFRQAWKLLAGALRNKKLVVDLRGVTHVDVAGRESLAEVHKQTGARFLADTPMTTYFADEACQPNSKNGRTKRGG